MQKNRGSDAINYEIHLIDCETNGANNVHDFHITWLHPTDRCDVFTDSETGSQPLNPHSSRSTNARKTREEIN